MRRFNLNDTEEKAWKAWIQEHRLVCKGFEQELSFGATAQYEICFTPGMVGSVVVLRCDLCGEKLDITDYDCW